MSIFNYKNLSPISDNAFEETPGLVLETPGPVIVTPGPVATAKPAIVTAQVDMTYLSYEEKQELAKKLYKENKLVEDKQEVLREDSVEIAAFNQEVLQSLVTKSRPSVQSQGGSGIINIDSYKELSDLAFDEKLTPDAFYRFPYYAVAFDNGYPDKKAQFNGVIYEQKLLTPAIVKAGGPREYLTCQALSTSKISALALSNVFGQDELFLDHNFPQKVTPTYEMDGYDITKVTYTPGVKYIEIILESAEWSGDSGAAFANVFQQPNGYMFVLYADTDDLEIYVPYKVVDAATFKISVELDLAKYYNTSVVDNPNDYSGIGNQFYFEIVIPGPFTEPKVVLRNNKIQNITTNFDYRNLHFPLYVKTGPGGKFYGDSYDGEYPAFGSNANISYTSTGVMEMCLLFDKRLAEVNIKNIRISSGSIRSWFRNGLRLEGPYGGLANITIDNFQNYNSLRVLSNIKIGNLSSVACGGATILQELDVSDLIVANIFGQVNGFKAGYVVYLFISDDCYLNNVNANTNSVYGTSFYGQIASFNSTMPIGDCKFRDVNNVNVGRGLYNENLISVTNQDINQPAYVPPAQA